MSRWRARRWSLGRLLAAVALVLLVGFVLSWLWRSRDWNDPVSAAPAPLPAADLAAPQLQAEDVVVALPAIPASAPRPAATYAGCADPAASDPTTAERHLRRQGRRARQAVTAQLQGSRDAVDRALGLWLTTTPFMGQMPVLDGDEAQQRAALKKLLSRSAAQHADSQDAVLALLQMAQAGASPTLYALAAQACETPPAGPASQACAAQTWQRWAALDPQDAQAWLAVLFAAQRRGDAAEVANALYQAGGASASRSLEVEVLQRVLRRLPPDASLRETLEVTTGITGVTIPWAMSTPMAVLRLCTPGATLDANRQQACARLASQQLAQAQTLTGLNSALVLAHRLGMPADQWQTAQDELGAAQWVVLQVENLLLQDTGDRPSLSCESLTAMNLYTAALAQQPQRALLGALAHQASQRTGLSLAQLAQLAQAAEQQLRAP